MGSAGLAFLLSLGSASRVSITLTMTRTVSPGANSGTMRWAVAARICSRSISWMIVAVMKEASRLGFARVACPAHVERKARTAVFGRADGGAF